MCSDASNVAYGGIGKIMVATETMKSHGNWEEMEKGCSSTWREMKALSNVLRSLKESLRGQVVQW